MAKVIKISDLRYFLIVCSMKDVAIDGEIALIREETGIQGFASIEQTRSGFFSPKGQSIQQERNQRTHKIVMRYRSDINISSAAWLYEKRGLSSPRWFKVIKIAEFQDGNRSHFQQLDCREVSRGDELTTPVAEGTVDAAIAAKELPEGVKI